MKSGALRCDELQALRVHVESARAREGVKRAEHIEGSKRAEPIVAILVPFRQQKEQDREGQLCRFLDHMSRFLRGPLPASANRPSFLVVVVQQTQDGRKFNRGQLLNAGFYEAERLASPMSLSAIVLHDVDLLPSAGLLAHYCDLPTAGSPVHLALLADKYAHLGIAYSARFLGGVTSLSPADFVACNGFPNDYWGWGVEDDQLYVRAEHVGALGNGIRRPPAGSGSYEDLDTLSVYGLYMERREGHLWNDKLDGTRGGKYQLDAAWSGRNGLCGSPHTVLAHNEEPLTPHIDGAVHSHADEAVMCAEAHVWLLQLLVRLDDCWSPAAKRQTLEQRMPPSEKEATQLAAWAGRVQPRWRHAKSPRANTLSGGV